MEEYRYECGSVEGFVQRAVVLAQRGYPFFVQGEVPKRKDPADVDEKMLSKYDLRKTRRQRAYRKARGLPNGHFFRFERTWVAMATSRKFFLEVDENERVADLRDTPIRVGGYTVSLRRDGSARRQGVHRMRASVRLDRPTYEELSGYFASLAVHRTGAWLAGEFWRLSSAYQAYAPVRRQFRAILRRVNEGRALAGFERVPVSCLRVVRVAPRHFEGPCDFESNGVGPPCGLLRRGRSRERMSDVLLEPGS